MSAPASLGTPPELAPKYLLGSTQTLRWATIRTALTMVGGGVILIGLSLVPFILSRVFENLVIDKKDIFARNAVRIVFNLSVYGLALGAAATTLGVWMSLALPSRARGRWAVVACLFFLSTSTLLWVCWYTGHAQTDQARHWREAREWINLRGKLRLLPMEEETLHWSRTTLGTLAQVAALLVILSTLCYHGFLYLLAHSLLKTRLARWFLGLLCVNTVATLGSYLIITFKPPWADFMDIRFMELIILGAAFFLLIWFVNLVFRLRGTLNAMLNKLLETP